MYVPQTLSALRNPPGVALPDPLERQQTLASLASGMQSGQLRQQQIEANQRGVEADQRVSQVLQNAKFDENGLDPQSRDALLQLGSPHALDIVKQLDANVQGKRKSDADLRDTQSAIDLRAAQAGNIPVDNERADKQLAQLIANQQAEREQAAANAQATANKPIEVAGSLVGPDGKVIYQGPEKPPPNIQNQTVETAEGVFQFNPKSGKYDIRVGGLKPTSGKAGAGGDADEIQAYVGWLARGAVTPPNVPIAIRGAVLKEAERQGISIMSDTERANIGSPDSAKAIIQDIKKYSAKIHTSTGPTARAGGLLRSGAALVGYDDDVSLLKSKAGELALLIRALGEKGALAEGDVTRALKLIPVSPTWTKGEAEGMISDLEGILDTVQKDKVRAAGGTGGKKSDPLGIR